MIGHILGHYRIVEKIGAGGMGEVYRAHDDQLGRDVALKVLPSHALADETARRQFRKEALALAKLNHPNIETVHEFNTQDGLDFLVIELIPGSSLREKLKRGPLPENEIVHLGTQFAGGLAAAHEHGVVHRDLKPGNLMITPDGRLKILDFGLARLVAPTQGGEVTQSITIPAGAILGTVPYMSPEQLRGMPGDARSDVYAAGAVLYEMATGNRPFPQAQRAELIGAILQQPPDPPSSQNPRVTPILENVILKALEKEPSRRYQSARELHVDLERLRTPTAPITAWRVSDTAWHGIWKTLHTHPRRVALSMSMIVVALVAIFWFVGTRPVLSFSPRDWILLTDFDNQTGETVFDRSLLAALTVSLEQSAHANIFPRVRIPDTLKRMNKPATEGINESVGREICLRENIRGLLNCRIARVGQEYVVSAQLIDPHSGNSVRSYLERAKGQNNILNALDNIANRLRRDLGESLSSIQMADRPLPLVTTSSLQALKNYVDARDAWSRGKYDEAVSLFKNALQLDPDFAMTHAALGGAYYSFRFNDPVDGKTEYEKALQVSTRTTERERLSIQVGYADNLNHVGEANNLYHLYLDKYPDDWRIRSNFARMLMMNSQYQEAIQQYMGVIRIAPKDGGAYINIATSYSGLGRTADALRYYAQAFELEPTWKTTGNLNHEYGFTLVRNGDETAARSVFDLALEKPEGKGLAQRSLGWLALYHGQYRAARTSFEAALLHYTAIKAPLSEARQHFLLSIVADGQSDRVRMLHQLDEAAKFLPEVGPKVWLGSLTGCAYARAGVPKKAEKILQSIKPAVDFNNAEQSSQYHRLEGEIALAQGRKAQALESFNLAQNEKSDAQTMEALARAYVAARDLNQAIAWYEKLIESPLPPLGAEPQQDWLAAHYHMAKAYLARGEKDKAAPVLEKLLTLWKDADPDIPVFIAAKSEHAKLK